MFSKIKAKLWVFLNSANVSSIIFKLFVSDGFLKTKVGKIFIGPKPSLAMSLLFWKLYEREDAYFVNRYLHKNDTVIELGASLGFVTLNIAQKANQVICVEANATAFDWLNQTLVANQKASVRTINAAIDYSGKDHISFGADESTLFSKKNTDQQESGLVKTIKLSDIVIQEKVDNYSLVCDIEGAEIEIFANENLAKCKLIIIELHETNYLGESYSITALQNLIVAKGFKLIDNQGNTFVFINAQNNTHLS